MHHYRAKRVIKARYKETTVVDYRQDNHDLRTPSTYTFLDYNDYRMDFNGQTLPDANVQSVFSINMRARKT